MENLSGARPRGSSSPIEKLTDREFEVFQLIGQGKSTRDIAAQLSLSPKTVDVHRANIKEKLGLQDATALIYDGSSPESTMGVPLTVVHTETVSDGRGYVLDCLYATAEAERARPIVDFIIANFATRSDADCCIGAEVAPEEETSPAQ